MTHNLDHSLRNAVQQMRQEVESLDANRLLNTAPEDLKDYLVAQYCVDPIRLLRDDWYANHQDMPVDVRYDTMRWIDDKSRPVMVPGERIEVRMPFEGDAELFYAQPNTMTSSPPRAVVERNELGTALRLPLRCTTRCAPPGRSCPYGDRAVPRMAVHDD